MIEQRRVVSVVETAETPDCSDHAGVSGDRAAYAIGRKTIVSMVDGIDAVTKTFAGLSGFVFLLFVISQSSPISPTAIWPRSSRRTWATPSSTLISAPLH